MKESDLLQGAASRFLEVIDPLIAGAQDPALAASLAEALRLPPGAAVAIPTINPDAIAAVLAYTQSDDSSLEAFAEIVDDLILIADAIRGFVEAVRAHAGEPIEPALVEEGLHQIFQLLTLNYLRHRLPRLHAIMRLVGFIDEQISTHDEERLVVSRFRDLVKDPHDYFDATFGLALETEDDAERLSNWVLGPLGVLLGALPYIRLHTRTLYKWEPSPNSTTPVADRVSGRALTVTFDTPDPHSFPFTRPTVSAIFVPKVHQGPGLLLAYGSDLEMTDIAMKGGWKADLHGTSETIAELFIPFDGRPARFLNNYPTDFEMRAMIHRDADPGTEKKQVFFLGGKRHTRLELARVTLAVRWTVAKDANYELDVQVASRESLLVFDPTDGFLLKILPDKIPVEFAIGYSTERKFYAEGGGSGLRLVIPIDKTLGSSAFNIRIQFLVLDFRVFQNPIEIDAAVSFAATLGPVVASVDQIGLRMVVPSAGHSADLPGSMRTKFNIPEEFTKWVLDWLPDFRVKPPSGVGLAIECGTAVRGGGFLFYDADKAEYAGVLQLAIQDRLVVTAIGLLTTRLPDGSSGFSLLVIITAQGFGPYPLGWGFTLNGLGGLLGIRRTMAVDVLRAGLRNRTLDTILFPTDPVRDAPQIISTLRTVFPPAERQHLFGPIAIIGWGTPTMVTLQIGAILEVRTKSPTNWIIERLVLLAQIDAILPSPQEALVELHMDAIGVVDFTQGDVSLDATLYHSQIQGCAISGDMALRANFGATPLFVLAVGGVHPAFKDLPPAFPSLRRIAMGLDMGANARLRLEGYQALTSNTAQIGARLELYAKQGGFSIEGWLGFDALFYFRPFQFVADVSGSVTVRKGSHTITSVGIDMTLSGPAPWHARGHATFNLLGFKHSVGFDKQIGEEAEALPLEVVDVAARLEEAIADTRNWMGELPAGEQPLVVLKPADRTTLQVHPLSDLTFRQCVVPLGLSITRFGEAQPGSEKRFALHEIRIGGDAVRAQPETEHFAAAQFLELGDEEKLSRPSFEHFEAGLRIDTDADAGPWMRAPITFETYLIDPERGGTAVQVDDYDIPEEAAAADARFGAAALCLLRRTGKSKYRNTGAPVGVTDAIYGIATVDGLEPTAIEGVRADEMVSYWRAADALRATAAAAGPAGGAELQVVRR